MAVAAAIIAACWFLMDYCMLRYTNKHLQQTIARQQDIIASLRRTAEINKNTIEIQRSACDKLRNRGDNWKHLSEGKPFVIEVNASDFSLN